MPLLVAAVPLGYIILPAAFLLFLIYPLVRFLCEKVIYRRPLRASIHTRHRAALGLGLCGGIFSATIGVVLQMKADERIEVETRRIADVRARGEVPKPQRHEDLRYQEDWSRRALERHRKDRTAGLYVAVSGVLALLAAPVVFRNGPGAGVLLAGVALIPAIGSPGLVCCNLFVMLGAIIASFAPRPPPS